MQLPTDCTLPRHKTCVSKDLLSTILDNQIGLTISRCVVSERQVARGGGATEADRVRTFLDHLSCRRQVNLYPNHRVASTLRDKIIRSLVLAPYRLPTSVGYIPLKDNQGADFKRTTWIDIFKHQVELIKSAATASVLEYYPLARCVVTDEYLLKYGLCGKKPDNNSGLNIFFMKPFNKQEQIPSSLDDIHKVVVESFHDKIWETPADLLKHLNKKSVTYIFEPTVDKKHLKEMELRAYFGTKPSKSGKQTVYKPTLIYVNETKHEESNKFDKGVPVLPSQHGEHFTAKIYELYESVIKSFLEKTGLTADDFKNSIIRIDCFHLQKQKEWKSDADLEAEGTDPDSADHPKYKCLIINEVEVATDTCIFIDDFGTYDLLLNDLAGNIKFALVAISQKAAIRPILPTAPTTDEKKKSKKRKK